MLDAIWLFGGLLLLAAGGEALVRSAGSLARWLGFSGLVAGTLIVGPGTSMPELVVSVLAAAEGRADLAVGNVVGSNISNSLLILGSAALILPMVIHRQALIRDGLSLLIATGLTVALMHGGQLGRLEGGLLLLLLFLWLAWTLISEGRRHSPRGDRLAAESAVATGVLMRPLKAGALLFFSLLALGAGAGATLHGATGLASSLGVSEALIGLTVVALGTSLPEWAVTLIAALRRQADVAVGNILGSNLFNLLGILGASALVQPLNIHPGILHFDRWVLLATTLLLLAMLLTGRRITRPEAALLLTAWVAWLLWIMP